MFDLTIEDVPPLVIAIPWLLSFAYAMRAGLPPLKGIFNNNRRVK